MWHGSSNLCHLKNRFDSTQCDIECEDCIAYHPGGKIAILKGIQGTDDDTSVPKTEPIEPLPMPSPESLDQDVESSPDVEEGYGDDPPEFKAESIKQLPELSPESPDQGIESPLDIEKIHSLDEVEESPAPSPSSAPDDLASPHVLEIKSPIEGEKPSSSEEVEAATPSPSSVTELSPEPTFGDSKEDHDVAESPCQDLIEATPPSPVPPPDIPSPPPDSPRPLPDIPSPSPSPDDTPTPTDVPVTITRWLFKLLTAGKCPAVVEHEDVCSVGKGFDLPGNDLSLKEDLYFSKACECCEACMFSDGKIQIPVMAFCRL